jgi:hypothetical protein
VLHTDYTVQHPRYASGPSSDVSEIALQSLGHNRSRSIPLTSLFLSVDGCQPKKTARDRQKVLFSPAVSHAFRTILRQQHTNCFEHHIVLHCQSQHSNRFHSMCSHAASHMAVTWCSVRTTWPSHMLLCWVVHGSNVGHSKTKTQRKPMLCLQPKSVSKTESLKQHHQPFPNTHTRSEHAYIMLTQHLGDGPTCVG